MNSEYEKRRRQILLQFASEQQARDSNQAQQVKTRFANKANLVDQIETSIFPALVRLETANGRVGMGFFQHERWLVSNAHVIKHRSEIDEGIVLTRCDGSICLLEAEQAFHRPWESVISPDIVVVNTSKTFSVIPSTPLSLDPTYPSEHYFYVDLNFEIHYLALVSEKSELPMRFVSLDGQIPQLGCSGTPIFAATIILGKSPRWRFTTVGALYARCVTMHGLESPTYQICAVPIAEEFEQIRSILIALESSEHYRNRAMYSEKLGDESQAVANRNMSGYEQALALQGIHAFAAGHSLLEIDLPEGLEKLAGSTFVSLAQSYLRTTAQLSIPKIKETFLQFTHEISLQTSIVIKVTRETTLIQNEYWRLDCKPGTNGQYWVLQVQDNTGKGVKVPGMQKSASSVFAEIKVPVSIEFINGQALSQDIVISQTRAEEKEMLLATAKITSGPQKKVLQSQADALHVSIIAGSSDSGCTSEQYRPARVRRATTPMSLSLFEAISETVSDTQAFATLSRLSGDAERLNSVNAMGNTPLMVLLQDPELHNKPTQLAKVQCLATLSMWEQPNVTGKTANHLLNDHPNAEELRNTLQI